MRTAGLLMAAAAAALFLKGEREIFFLLPLLLPLYSKLERGRVLDNFVRGKLFGFIQTNPGKNLSSIMLNLDLPHGTLSYHLGRLEREELIRSREDGPHKRYYPANTTLPEPGPTRLTGSQETVYDLICDEPGISQIELAMRLGVSNVAVTYHLEALLEKEVIFRKRIGLRYRYHPNGPGGPGRTGPDTSIAPPP